MSRSFAFGSLAVAGLVSLASPAQADVFVRAPFVRVYASGAGVQVRAPFVCVSVPSFASPAPVFVPQQPVPLVPPTLPAPTPLPGGDMTSGAAGRPMTLSEFSRCFRGGCGTYETVLLNPCTCQPCVVRFCLPDCPRRVTCSRDEIVFHYGLLKKIRIHFDSCGATVTSLGL